MSESRSGAGILLVDIGNTRIKWAVWRAGRLGRMQADVYAGWSSSDFRRLLEARSGLPARILVASVADAGVVRRLAAAARDAAAAARHPALELIATSRRAAGVVTHYTEPWRLGVDRFLGVIAAHHLAGSRGACVINAGTAVTLDLVNGRGVHYGGAILPGTRLMVESLLQRTVGIAPRARGVSSARPRSSMRGSRRGASLFACNTAAAIEQGALQAVAGAVDRAIAASRAQLGEAPVVILTGGGAAELRRLLCVRLIEAPDLVLRGIALHAGLALR